MDWSERAELRREVANDDDGCKQQAAALARSLALRAISVAANGGFVVSSGGGRVAVGAGEEASNPSWPVVAGRSPLPSLPPSFVRGCNYNLDGQKMAVSNAIFSERRKRKRRLRSLARLLGVGGKSDDFWPGASANESCGRNEREEETQTTN